MLVALVTGSMMLVGGATALASHGNAELPGSDFEIDDDANLKQDDADPKMDWGSVDEVIGLDAETGQGDDSYKGGTKEDTTCPDETTGSIPNNKSDLLTFHVYEEDGTPGFLNLGWSRVSDPSGTTLMDFELNQGSNGPCANGPNVQRDVGDLLVEYAIDQGGARATISARFWDGSAWGPETNLSAANPICGGNACAVGTINQSPIPQGESYELNAEKQQYTFGEMQIDLRYLFQNAGSECISFGYGMVKSRSSDSFTSQLKDFIRPQEISVTNCAKVITRKMTQPSGATQQFEFTSDTPDGTFYLADGQSNTQTDVFFGTYSVDETSIPTGWELIDIDCSASNVPVTTNVGAGTTDFTLDSADDVVDCTFTNRAFASLTFVKDADRDGVSFDYTTSGGLTPSTFSLANGESQPYTGLAPDDYGATETVPAGWNLVSQNCDNGDTADSVTLGAGDDVTCTFVNRIQTGAIEVVKTRKFAGATEGDPFAQPHPNVEFSITNETNGTSETVMTGADGTACVDGLPVSVLDGDYTVTETVPTGYVADGGGATTVAVTEGDCGGATGTPVEASFSNSPLTDVSIDVTSQDPDATRSTIDCVDANDTSVGSSGNPTDPASLDIADLEIGTYTCTIVIDP